MRVGRGIWILALCLPILSCGSKAEPRSQQYFESHIDEARRVDAGCRDGSVRGEECAGADIALEAAKGRANMDHFLGKDK